MKTLVIKGSEWMRGTVSEYISGRLLDPNTKKMCCLGIQARTLGLKEEEILGVCDPVNIPYHKKGSDNVEEYLNMWVGKNNLNTALCNKATAINDRRGYTDEERIEKLRPIFREVGYEIDWRPNE